MARDISLFQRCTNNVYIEKNLCAPYNYEYCENTRETFMEDRTLS